MPILDKINALGLCSVLALVVVSSPHTNASSKSLAELQQQIISMEACGSSITHELCNLDILDESTRATIKALHESKQKLKELNAIQHSRSGNSAASNGLGCYTASITKPTPFMGNSGEVFLLDDSSVWEVMHEYEYLYEYYPVITACPDSNFIVIGEKRLSAMPIAGGNGATANVIETNVDGDWNGWSGDTIVRLMNGQVWEQVGLALSLSLGLGNDVLIYERSGMHYMMVDGEDEAVMVRRLK